MVAADEMVFQRRHGSCFGGEAGWVDRHVLTSPQRVVSTSALLGRQPNHGADEWPVAPSHTRPSMMLRQIASKTDTSITAAGKPFLYFSSLASAANAGIHVDSVTATPS